MTPRQRELKDKHGTPEEFEAAVWRAYADLWITEGEASAGISKYRREWLEAGDVRVRAKP